MKTTTKLGLAMCGALLLGSAANTQAADKKIERVWKAKCGSCHGADGKGQTEQGKKKGAEDMTSAEWQKGKKDEDMKKAIMDGFKKEKNGVKQEMEAYKDKLKPEEIDELIKMVRAFGGGA